MEYANLGRSGLSVSRLVLGTLNFGWNTPEADARALMDRAHEHGINFFDTADVYGANGGTETIIGNWFAAGGGRRERTVLATKLYGDMGDWPNEGRLSALHIRRACEASLKRLRTDYLDLYQMHHVDRSTPFEEIWEAMEVLRAQGKILYAGSSNFAAWHLVKAQEAAVRRHFSGLVSEQSFYNLLNRTVELEVLPACQDYGIGMIPWSPLAGGLLGGILRRNSLRTEVIGANLERYRTVIAAFEAMCDGLGSGPAEVALAWLLSRPGVTGPIVGPRTISHLDAALRAFETELDAESLRRLDELFPGPGGPAPEAYTW
ncbi:aldo/keto reductase [Amycolatopsis sp. VS8301801F10]|uniref:aldo/keto reductase n=1 Tax=Amycolatopsis sp. VS8301801F10 TaxID=2652442 RepID=UPI0038FC4360